MIYRQVDLSMTDDTVLVDWTMCQLTSYIVVRIIRIITCLSVVVTSERSTEFLNWQNSTASSTFSPKTGPYIHWTTYYVSFLKIFISAVKVLVSFHQSNLSSSVILNHDDTSDIHEFVYQEGKFRIYDQSGAAIKELIFVSLLHQSITFEVSHRTQEYAFLLSRIIGYDSDSNVKI